MIDMTLIFDNITMLAEGLKNTIFISMFSCMIGFLFGICIAAVEEYGGIVFQWIMYGYVTIIRGTPMLIQILGVYYMLPMIGIHCPPMLTAIIAIGMNSGAYLSQIIKAGISSVSRMQVEAAYVLGFTNYQTARYIVFPQAIRTIFPALSNELVTLIKDSSLASTINVLELTKQGRVMMSQTYNVLSVFFILFCIYLTITSVVTYGMHCIEKRMKSSC